MNLYDIWISGDGKCYLVHNMETSHIHRCVKQIDKSADGWRMISFSVLTDTEKEDIHSPLSKAWFVANALDYLYSFKHELEMRQENTYEVDKTIARIINARAEY